MNFKIGQTVVLIDNFAMAAEVGAEGMIYKIGEYISVKWKENEKWKGQGHGGYYAHQFKPLIEVGEQLVFDFMKEQ